MHTKIYTYKQILPNTVIYIHMQAVEATVADRKKGRKFGETAGWKRAQLLKEHKENEKKIDSKVRNRDLAVSTKSDSDAYSDETEEEIHVLSPILPRTNEDEEVIGVSGQIQTNR
jgi:hypothetical protein